MSNTPKLAMPELSASQASKEITVNDSLRILDALVGLNVLDKDLTGPPGSPADGATYIIPASGTTGAWVGHEKDIAYFKSTAWIYIDADEGMRAYVTDEDKLYLYNGTSWVILASSAAVYDVGGSVGGTPVVSSVLIRVPMVRSVSFPASFAGSKAVCGTNPSSTTVFSIKKNGSEIGTASFNTSGVCTFGGAGGSFTSATPDVLTVVAPANLFGIADLGFMLVGALA